MTICNKIQTLGETMETNLNARGVSCTFGTGTGESTVLEMVEMVNGTNFKGSSDVNLKIGANRPYLLTGETTDVVVKLEDGLCEPLKNKNVTIEQSLFRDNGTSTSHNDIWTLSNATLTRNASDSTLLETTATGYAMNNPYNKIPPNSVVEFDICQTDGSVNYSPIYIRNDGGGVSLSNISYGNLGAGIGDWVHIKIVFNNTDTITVYSDKLSEPFTKTLSATSTNYRVMLYCGGDMTTIKFKNYVVYENINGVTDEKGEFALYDVSVTDDTYFTATYGTETASCLVEYCSFVDYAVTSNHNDSWDGLTYMNRGTDGTTINNTGSGTLFERIKINNSTAPFSNGDFTVTLKILSVSGSDNRLRVLGATVCSGEPYAQSDYTLLSTSIGEFKMVYDSTNHTVKVYKDGTLLITNNRALCGNLNFNFRISAGSSIKYKDLRVKSL